MACLQNRLEVAAQREEALFSYKGAQAFVAAADSCVARRTGRLTAEERAARLAEMAGNADVHEEARWSRLRNAKAVDAAEEAAEEAALQARILTENFSCQLEGDDAAAAA